MTISSRQDDGQREPPGGEFLGGLDHLLRRRGPAALGSTVRRPRPHRVEHEHRPARTLPLRSSAPQSERHINTAPAATLSDSFPDRDRVHSRDSCRQRRRGGAVDQWLGGAGDEPRGAGEVGIVLCATLPAPAASSSTSPGATPACSQAAVSARPTSGVERSLPACRVGQSNNLGFAGSGRRRVEQGRLRYDESSGSQVLERVRLRRRRRKASARVARRSELETPHKGRPATEAGGVPRGPIRDRPRGSPRRGARVPSPQAGTEAAGSAARALIERVRGEMLCVEVAA